MSTNGKRNDTIPTPLRVPRNNNGAPPPRPRGRPFDGKTHKGGRPKGALNKTTNALRLAAHEVARPLAVRFIEKGQAHMLACEKDECDECWRVGTFAFAYAYGKPTQPIAIDDESLRTWVADVAQQYGVDPEVVLQTYKDKERFRVAASG